MPVVALVEAVKPHPDAATLSVCTVNGGKALGSVQARLSFVLTLTLAPTLTPAPTLTLPRLEQGLLAAGVPLVRIDGSTAHARRDQCIAQFRTLTLPLPPNPNPRSPPLPLTL